MRENIVDESVDLIYLDPPFNSKRLYNAFIGGAQWIAFDDTWRWHEAVNDFHEVASDVGFAGTIEGLRQILGEGTQLAYLSYMANRLRECRRILKPTGSIYLHCDPTMSHYLKLVMDGLFVREGGEFINEIVWHYDGPQRPSRKKFGSKHDIIFRYSKTKKYYSNPTGIAPFQQLSPVELKKHKQLADGRYYYTTPRGDYTDNSIRNLELENRVEHTKTGKIRVRHFLSRDTMGNIGRKKQLHDVWNDIVSLGHAGGNERLGYPTQKPLNLLRRVITASTNPDDVVLDPFCGCGTTIHAAQSLQRCWIGIDICVNACKIIESRLRNHFDSLWSDVEFIGMPKTRDDAKTLASLDSFRFERWAASLVDGMEANTRQRGDKGIDGKGRIPIRKGKFIDIVSQVKGGGTGPGDVQAFNGARQQARADLGVFTCFEDRVTPRMRDAAASTGRFMDTPIVQIYTIEDYFEGRKPQMPKAA